MSETQRSRRNHLVLTVSIAGVLVADSAHAKFTKPVPIPDYDAVAFCQNRANHGALSVAACVGGQYTLQRIIAEVWDGLLPVVQSKCVGVASRYHDYDVLFQCIDSYDQNE